MAILHQLLKYAQKNEKKMEDMQKDIEDLKKRMSRLSLSSFVSSIPPEEQVDLAPCLRSQSTEPPAEPAKPQEPKEQKVSEARSVIQAYFESSGL